MLGDGDGDGGRSTGTAYDGIRPVGGILRLNCISDPQFLKLFLPIPPLTIGTIILRGYLWSLSPDKRGGWLPQGVSPGYHRPEGVPMVFKPR